MWVDEEIELSPRQSMTQEGFLRIRDVPLARTGVQIYYPHEIPELDFKTDGPVRVQRDANEVFDPASIASYQGKPVTDDHPSELVGPDNWQEHAIGFATNVRRGEPPDDDVLVGDLIIASRKGIDMVRNGGRRQVSIGYDANYEPLGPDIARQTRIRANHIALVDEGRCGVRCMIGDSKPQPTDSLRKEMRRHAKQSERTMKNIAASNAAFWKVHSHHGY
jgi:hypothetical protein